MPPTKREPDAWRILHRASRAGIPTEGLTPLEAFDLMADRLLEQIMELGNSRRRGEELEARNRELERDNRELRRRLRDLEGK